MRLIALPLVITAIVVLMYYFRTPIGRWFNANGKLVGLVVSTFAIALAFSYWLGLFNVSFS